jgi:hypothetical protein
MHQMFQQTVLGGALRQFGMPSFSEDLKAAQVRSIEGYVLNGRRSRRARTRPRSIEQHSPAIAARAPCCPFEKFAGQAQVSRVSV